MTRVSVLARMAKKIHIEEMEFVNTQMSRNLYLKI